MPITSSVILKDARPAEGTGMVIAEHIWSDGQRWPAVFEAHSSENLQARLDAMIAAREATRVENEINFNINQVLANGSQAVIFVHQSTNAQNLAALRDAYRAATRLEAIMIGDFLSSLTNLVLMNILSMTNAQVNTFRANKLTPAATTAAAIRAATGNGA